MEQEDEEIQDEEVPDEAGDDMSLPELDSDWCDGKFIVNINRCHECILHYNYSRHSEDEYVTAFNEMTEAINLSFPSAEVIGNYDKPSYNGCFDIYIRGVGKQSRRDREGRLWLYKKISHGGRWPSYEEIVDKISLLALQYGDSNKLGEAQTAFNNSNRHMIPHPYSGKHEYPCPEPENIRKQPNIEDGGKVVNHDLIMVCTNWGCGQEYKEDKNEKGACLHHPGQYQFGSLMGLWPESWTCCRGEWSADGCRKGKHRGTNKDEPIRHCVNHGEPNPD